MHGHTNDTINSAIRSANSLHRDDMLNPTGIAERLARLRLALKRVDEAGDPLTSTTILLGELNDAVCALPKVALGRSATLTVGERLTMLMQTQRLLEELVQTAVPALELTMWALHAEVRCRDCGEEIVPPMDEPATKSWKGHRCARCEELAACEGLTADQLSRLQTAEQRAETRSNFDR